jgi:hypothetical protein
MNGSITDIGKALALQHRDKTHHTYRLNKVSVVIVSQKRTKPQPRPRSPSEVLPVRWSPTPKSIIALANRKPLKIMGGQTLRWHCWRLGGRFSSLQLVY